MIHYSLIVQPKKQGESRVKKVYKSVQGESALADLYDRQLDRLNAAYEDLFVETRFGAAHLLKLGKADGKPLLLFHGGNSTTPYYLAGFVGLFEEFCIYAVDIVGHPGKSSQRVLSHRSTEYGKWASDVISGLGFQKICCMGGSYGGGVLVKLMCVAPEKIERSVLIVPSAIANISTFSVMMKMGMPMLLYVLTKRDYWLTRAILPMAIRKESIDADSFEMVKNVFDHVVVKVGMPTNAGTEQLRKCKVPTLLIAAEKDCLFPGKKVIARAKELLPDCKTHLLGDQGHLCVLPTDVMNMIRDFVVD
jgi:pimeloyl-ACP methyl ester carboxylesterase